MPRRFISLACVFILCGLAWSQSSDQREDTSAASDSSKNASLSGTIINAITGEPVPRAVVSMYNEASRERPSDDLETSSDIEGRFTIPKIPPGTYALHAHRPGFSGIKIAGKRHPIDILHLSLSPGQRLERFEILLAPAAVVLGKVIDQDGDPVVGAVVTLLEYTFAPAGRKMAQIDQQSTNDLGEYRIYGIPPGEYFLSVNPPQKFRRFPQASGKNSKARYPVTYYPGTWTQSKAVRLPLKPGEETRADFNLAAQRVVRIAGRILDIPSQSPAQVRLMTPDGEFSDFTEVRDDGSFEFKNVVPGTYELTANTAQQKDETQMLSGQRTVTVTNVDLDQLTITLRPFFGELTGRVIFEGVTDQKVQPRMYLALRSINWREPALDSEPAGGWASTFKPDGTFTMRTSGTGTVLVSIYNTPDSNYYLKSVHFAGRDVTDSGIQIPTKGDDLEIVLSRNASSIAGVVHDANDKPIPDALVLLVPDESSRIHQDRFGNARTDQDGKFTLRGLHPGNYKLLAFQEFSSIIVGSYVYDDFLKKYEDQGTPIDLEEKGKYSMTLKPMIDPE
jgi:hypothetical protein